MSLASALQTGKSSLLASQTAIEVTGTNISNVNTPGYSRQTAEFSDYPALLHDGFFVGQGVDVGTISREHDAFLESQLGDKSIELGYREAKSNPLSAMEQAVSISDSSLSSKIDEFFAAWQGLASNPSGSVEREGVLQAGTQVADAFHSAAEELQAIATSTEQQLEAGMQGLNDKLAQLADLNGSIASARGSDYSPNADMDKRDMLVQELGQALGARPVEGDNGMVDLMLPPLSPEPGGTTLVSGDTAAELTLNLKEDVPGSVTVTLNDKESTPSLDPWDGELKASLEIRDKDIPDAMTKLDTLAQEFAEQVNTAHKNGTDLDGNTGRDFFTFATGDEGSAARIEISGAVGTRQIAAGTSAGMGDNTNALELAGLGKESLPGLDGSTFVGYYGSLASSIGTASSRNDLALDGAQDSMVQLQNMRDAKVGVSLEEEMVSLMQFQKGFEASARFISTVDELMDTVLGMKR
jgi:flagellar hook-associated protein 1 FlgK